jgi:hypothetical protein
MARSDVGETIGDGGAPRLKSENPLFTVQYRALHARAGMMCEAGHFSGHFLPRYGPLSGITG